MNIQINTNAIIQNGSAFKIFEHFPQYKNEEICVIIDQGFANTETGLQVLKYIDTINQRSKILKYDHVGEPTYNYLRILSGKVKKLNPKVIFGIGGGSTLDSAKACAVLVTNKKDPIAYRGFNKILNKGIPCLCIPTTAGTGSEASYNASFVDTDSSTKMGINGLHMFATHSILDGNMVINCPNRPMVSATIDALTHNLEAFTCLNANAVIDQLCLLAIKLIFDNYNGIASNSLKPEAALNLLTASHIGGIVQMNTGSGIAAAISYPLSVYYQVPHGIGGGIFLAGVVKYNIDKGYYKYSKINKILKNNENDPDDCNSAKKFLSSLIKLKKDLKIPIKLHSFGITKYDYDKICAVMATQQAGFDQNPISFTVKSSFPQFIKKYL